jgi:Type IV secretory pathway, VirB4 components
MEPAKEPYCRMLAADHPLSLDRVDSPWTVVPDLPRYNRRAFNFVKHDLGILKRACAAGQRPNSRGILVLGDAGTGKTHLLMRVASLLSQENPLLFIRRPTNEEAVGQHIWENILESLSQRFSTDANSPTQLDVLLARVFARILIDALEIEFAENRESEQKQRWIEALRSDPLQIASLLGQGEGRHAALNMFRRRILNHLNAFRPHADQTIARVLVTYCLVAADNKKRILRSWLAGHEIDETEANELGLSRTAVSDDGTLSLASLLQAREHFSMKCIQTLGELSTYHAPLILAFDQLEGLRHSPTLTHRFGDTVRELFTMAPNFLVITCAFPSLWSEWFAQKLDDSAAQRIAQNRVELEAFAPEHGEQLLARHLDAWFSKYSLPTSLYPFTSVDVRELCARATSARAFLQAARTRFLDWLPDDELLPALATATSGSAPGVVTSREIAAAIQRQLRDNEVRNFNLFTTQLPSEQALFGKLHELVRALLQSSAIRETTVRNTTRVLPAHVRLHCQGETGDSGERSVVLAVCNANGIAFTSRVRNLFTALSGEQPAPAIILVRDERASATTPSMQKVLDEVCRAGGKFIVLKRETFSSLMALHDCLVAAEEGDLTAGVVVINKDKLLPHFRAIAATGEFTLLSLVAASVGTILPAAPLEFQDVEPVFNPSHAQATSAQSPEVDPPSAKGSAVVPELLDEAPSPPAPVTLSAPILLGFDKPIGKAVEWDVSIRTNPHLMIVGLPGMGKTTSLISICSQLADQGITPIVFSYHEDIDAALADRLGRLHRIDHSSLGFNPLRLNSSKDKAHIDSAGMMRDIFASIFPDLGELQTNQVRQAIKQSYEESLSRGAPQAGPRFRDFFKILQQQPKPDKGLMARLTELDDYGLFSSSSDEDSLLAISTPSVISLHCTQNEVVQRAFASLLFYRLYQEMFRRGLQQRITHAIVFDEAHRASRLKLLGSMGKEGRKYGLSLILASQEARDFSPSMYSAVANYLVLRVTDKDASALAKNVAPSSSAKQVADELKQLPKHEAIFFQEGSQPSRTRLSADAMRPACAELK